MLICLLLSVATLGISQVAQWLKNLPAIAGNGGISVWSLSLEDPLEEGMATHSQYSCLGNPMDRGAWWATVHVVTESDMTEHACGCFYTTVSVLDSFGTETIWPTMPKIFTIWLFTKKFADLRSRLFTIFLCSKSTVVNIFIYICSYPWLLHKFN